MTTGVVQEQNLEKQIAKQMGCMAGFFHIFDRHQILTGKRLCANKHVPSTPVVESTPVSETSSPMISGELVKQNKQSRSLPSPDRLKQTPLPDILTPAAEEKPKSPLPLTVFEFKEGTRMPWKFSKETPRLSLDSRAVVDAKGSLKPREIRTNAAIISSNRCENEDGDDSESDKNRRSPSVIARLMGLEPLQSSDPESPATNSQLRRSASESRASRDQYRFVDGVNFQPEQVQQKQNINGIIASNVIRENSYSKINNVAKEGKRGIINRLVDQREFAVCRARVEPAKAPPHRAIVQRKNIFHSAEFFPEQKQTVTVPGEIERRLKMRGIDEPSEDLETLKQILEVLQLKGLLHSNKSSNQGINNSKNFVLDRDFSQEKSPIVVMKPARSHLQSNRSFRSGKNSPTPSLRSRNSGTREASPAVSPRRDRPLTDRNTPSQVKRRNSISPTRSECSVKSPSRRINIETNRKGKEPTEQRKASPVRSPINRIKPDQSSNRRARKPISELLTDDEFSTVSESTISTRSQTDLERSKVEEYKDGKSLLERCDKLLLSIAEMTTTATELQPSPVSVLDSSFYKEESSPSPVMKRSIDFKEQSVESEDDMWSVAISFSEANSELDCDLKYISDILRALDNLPQDTDIFSSLESQQYLKGKGTSRVSQIERMLIFDTTNEILDRKRRLPPWKAVSPRNTCNGQSLLHQIWSEFLKIRERDVSEDLFEAICGVLKKDLAGDANDRWGEYTTEMSESVLDIERLILKDLISETIRDLDFSARCSQTTTLLRRKLVF